MTQPSDSRIQTTCLLILTGVAVGVTLFWLRGVLLPFVLAVFLAIMFLPVRNFFRNLGCRGPVALTATIFTGFIAIAVIAVVISLSATQMAAKSAKYEKQVSTLVTKVQGPLADVGIEVNADYFKTERFQSIVRGVVWTVVDLSVGLVSNGLLILIFFCFLLAGPTHTEGLAYEITESVRKYISTKFAVSALTGVLVGTTYWLLGVDLALVFGLLAFLFNFIPNVGSFIAVLLPLPVVLLDPDASTLTVVLAIGIPVVINFIIGNVLEPKMLGEAVGVHPITILLALVFWGVLWGIAGMFLAVPLTVSLKLLLERLDMTKPVARMMAGGAH